MVVYVQKKTHKSPGYRFLFKLKIRKMSGFNNSETAHVTFDPVSINCCEKTGFITSVLFEAAWY